MKRYINYIAIMLLAVTYSCKNKDAEPALPSYLQIPLSLTNFTGTGRIAIDGGLKLLAEGVEHVDPATKTYSGVIADINSGDVGVSFTVGQPLPYKQSSTVPEEYRANGALAIINTYAPGTYSLGLQATHSPRGEFADLYVNLPGPQIYFANSGTLTITMSTLIKTQGTTSLYRLQGTFQSTLTGSGVGLSSTQQLPPITGSFDLLLTVN